jgi:hypothetical protein
MMEGHAVMTGKLLRWLTLKALDERLALAQLGELQSRSRCFMPCSASIPLPWPIRITRSRPAG